MINKSIAYEKAFKFCIKIVNTYNLLSEYKKEFVLFKQLLQCGTSMWANKTEANGAISIADFSNRVSASFKEWENTYWLNLLEDSQWIDLESYNNGCNDADEIAKNTFLKSTNNRFNIAITTIS